MIVPAKKLKELGELPIRKKRKIKGVHHDETLHLRGWLSHRSNFYSLAEAMINAPTAMRPPPTMTCQTTFSFKNTVPIKMAKTSDRRSSGTTREALPSFRARYRNNDETPVTTPARSR